MGWGRGVAFQESHIKSAFSPTWGGWKERKGREGKGECLTDKKINLLQ